jgi:ATP-dependent helicase HrpA
VIRCRAGCSRWSSAGGRSRSRSEVDLDDAIADAVDELWRDGPGDILVFLPGEREIREAADHLRKHLASSSTAAGPQAEILPLFARLSQAEQDRVFEPATAGASCWPPTWPRPRSRCPASATCRRRLARVKRYSYRNKVEQLQVEPISQAAANQRAGRCGRVANGICIRLYDEKDFAGRPRFTDPEILRSSLAGVILRMKSLHLGQIEDFPFLEAAAAQGHRRRLRAAVGAGRGGRRQRADRPSAASWPSCRWTRAWAA